MEIIYQGQSLVINENLLTEMNAWERIGDIIKIRLAINSLMLDAKSSYEDGTLTKEKGHVIASALERMEFRFQKAWGFPQDKAYHIYQSCLHECTCPQSDNGERHGTDARWVSGDCLYHGKGE